MTIATLPVDVKQTPRRGRAMNLSCHVSPEYTNELVDKNTGLAHSAAWRVIPKYPGVDANEILSAAMLGLWRAARRFEPERGLKFSTLAFRACLNSAMHCAKAITIRKRVIRTQTMDVKYHCIPGQKALIKSLAEGEDREQLIRWVSGELKKLTPDEQWVIEKVFFEGLRQTDLRDMRGVSRQRIGQLYQGALRKLTRAFLDRRRTENY